MRVGNCKSEGLQAFEAGFEGVALDVGEMEGAAEVVGAEVALDVVGFDVVDAIHR